MRQVENTDPNARVGGEFTDVSQVEKYEISQEEYEKRSGAPARRDSVTAAIRLTLVYTSHACNLTCDPSRHCPERPGSEEVGQVRSSFLYFPDNARTNPGSKGRVEVYHSSGFYEQAGRVRKEGLDTFRRGDLFRGGQGRLDRHRVGRTGR